jgi:hypothetical protein
LEYEKLILVTRKTRLEGLIERFNTKGQAKFYIEHSGGDFELYELEHERYYAALGSLRKEISGLAKVQQIERAFLPNYLFSETDIVVTIGIDGLVVNTAKYLDGQPLIAVNPDPEIVDGLLLPFLPGNTAQAIRGVMKGCANLRSISMAEARLNDGQTLLAFNDFFVGVRSHTSARYTIKLGGREERQSSSGIIISTGVGSTGWLSSLVNMANGMFAGIGSFGADPPLIPEPRFDWEADRLVFVVREPFVSKTSSANMVYGEITGHGVLELNSEIPDGGVIFSDGVEADYLAFNAGSIATIGLAQKRVCLVVN